MGPAPHKRWQRCSTFSLTPPSPRADLLPEPTLEKGEYVFTLRLNGREGKACVRPSDLTVTSYLAPVPRAYPAGLIAVGQAEALAVRFARRMAPALWRHADHVIVGKASSVDQWGMYHVLLQAMWHDMWLPDTCDVWIRGYDGKVGLYTNLISEGDYKLPTVSLARAEAVHIALTSIGAKHPGAKLTLVSARLGCREGDGYKARWTVYAALGAPASEPQPGVSVRLDADTGAVLDVKEEIIYPPSWDRAKQWRQAEQTGYTIDTQANLIADEHPRWVGNDEVLFEGARSVDGLPLWAGPVTALYTANVGTGRVRCLLGGIRNDITEASRAGDLIAATYRPNFAFLLDLATGQFRFVGNEGHPAFEAAMEARGTRLCFVGPTMGGTAIHECRVGKADQRWEVGPWERVSVSRAAARYPVYSLDGNSIFFVGSTGASDAEEGTAWDLLRADRGRSGTLSASPRTIAKGIVPPATISTFPDGRRLLVAHQKGLDVVDLRANTKTRLAMPSLQDPDLPRGPALIPRQFALSPDGKRLAFCAYRGRGGAKEGAGTFLYVCNLDGKGIRRITPLVDRPVEPWVFPITGKTGIDAAQSLDAYQSNAPQ